MPPITRRCLPLVLVGLLLAVAGCPNEAEPGVTGRLPLAAPTPTPVMGTKPTGNLLDLLPTGAPGPTPTPTLAPLQPAVSVSASPASPDPTPSEQGWYEP